MIDQRDVKQDKETDSRQDDPKLQAEVIEDLDVASDDADELRGGPNSGRPSCMTARV